MEEMSKELDDLRAEVESLAAQLRAKSDLADGLKRASADQAARLRDARADAERHAAEAAARGEEAAAAGERCGQLEARLAEKEQALRQLCGVHEALKGTLREKTEGLEADKSGLLAALEDAEARQAEQEAALRARDGEVARLRGLLAEKERRCGEAEKSGVVAPREVVVRDDMLVKLEEEKAAVEGKLKWKAEQFRHLEEALKKVQDDFRAAKREWGSDRSTLVDRIGALEVDLDSKTRIAEDFRCRLEMCSQALAHEEGRRKQVEAEMSELRHIYGNVVSEYEEARSMVESLTVNRDGEIASLRSSLAEKVTLLKEMEYSKSHLEQENEDLRLTLKEYQEAQIDGADAVVSLKDLREKFRALEQTHRSCTDKLRDKEAEWRIQMQKLGSDLDGCLSLVKSKDTLIGELQSELLGSYKSLELQTVGNWEALIITTVVQSKFSDSCLCIDTLRLNMQHHFEETEREIASVRKQLEERNCAIVQSQSEQKQQSEVIAKLQGRIEELEHTEQEHEKMQRQLDSYKEMLEDTSRDVHCIKDEASEKENNLQEKLREALGALDEANCALADRKNELSQLEINLYQQKQAIEHLEKLKVDMQSELKGYIDSNKILKRDLDAALVAKMEAEEMLRHEKVKLLGALDEANVVLSERSSELSQFENNFHQQKQALEHLENLKVDMETELKTYMDENCVLKRDLDVARIANMECEECYTKEKEKLCGTISEKGKVIDELQQYIAVLEEENMGKKLDLCGLIKTEYEKSVQEVKNSYSEIVEVYDKKLLELEERVGFFEQKFTCREQEIMDMFDQEEADWYTLIAEKEIAISDIQQTVESVKVDIEQLLGTAAAKVTEVQLEVNQLYRFAETLNSLNIIQEHDRVFKDMLIAECDRELESLRMALVLEKEQSGSLKNLIEQLKAEATAVMLEKSKEHLEVANKLKSLEERKEMLEDQLEGLKTRTTDLSSVVIQERNELVDELTGLTNAIEEVIYGGENLMSNLSRILEKVNAEEPHNDTCSSEKTNARTSAPLIKNKSGHVVDRRSPLKEHNY
jgi:chromosome segregation ATPase